MSAGDNYYTAPLSILRSGKNHLEALEASIACGIVNAGIGYEKHHGQDEFKELLKEASKEATKQNLPTKPPRDLALKDADGANLPAFQAEQYWKYSHAGSKLLGIHGGARSSDAQRWLSNHRHGEVFFKMRSDWLWGAVYQARREDGQDVRANDEVISWREFRILAAILSAPVNRYGFTFLGWESIQARACGCHKKEFFRTSKESLPDHCQPLSRDQITRTVERLEALNFFIRFRDSKGDRGGKTAYSFRHKGDDPQASRRMLADAVAKYKADRRCMQEKVSANREADRVLALSNTSRPQVTGKAPASPPAT